MQLPALINRRWTIRLISLGGALVLSIVVASPTEAFWFKHREPPPYSALVVFGDSFSDPGNHFALTGEFVVAPYEPIPEASYLIGWFHLSNGSTWVEQLAYRMRLWRSARPAFRRPGVFTNYAVSGARASPGGISLVDLSGQVAAFLGDVGGAAPSDALYVIWIGGNDIRDALVAGILDPSGETSEAIITSAVETEAANIGALVASGATQFLVLNAPNVGVAPAITALGPDAVLAAEMLSVGYNLGLDAALDQLEDIFPHIDIIRFDVFSLLSAVVAEPEAFRLQNVTEPCLTFFVVENAVCRRPWKYLFWDAIHPTNKGHRIIRKAVQRELE